MPKAGLGTQTRGVSRSPVWASDMAGRGFLTPLPKAPATGSRKNYGSRPVLVDLGT